MADNSLYQMALVASKRARDEGFLGTERALLEIAHAARTSANDVRTNDLTSQGSHNDTTLTIQ